MRTPISAAPLLILAATVAGADEADNLLRNPGAEEGPGRRPAAWRAAVGSARGLTMARVTDQAHSGAASLAIGRDGPDDGPRPNEWTQELRDLPAGRTIRLRAFVRTRDADAAHASLQCWSADGKDLLAFASTPVFRGDQDWTLARSRAVVIPEGTATVVVRAALTGRGRAWFDDLALVVLGPPLANHPGAGPGDDALARVVPGRIVKTLPIEKDCTILAYIPDYDHGDVDHLAVEEKLGGARTLVDWPAVPEEDLDAPGRECLLALFARKVTPGRDPGALRGYDITADWPERTSWTTRPSTASEPSARAPFQAGEGWKVLDVTRLVRDRDGARGHGLMLRFAAEDKDLKAGAGYQFVSREAQGDWSRCHPVLLIVEPEKAELPDEP